VIPAELQNSNQEKTESLFWPQDVLPTAIPETRIYTWGYDVDINHVFSFASQDTVFQHAQSLLSDLANERTSDDDVSSFLISYIKDPDTVVN
jgi:hypothetical protein